MKLYRLLFICILVFFFFAMPVHAKNKIANRIIIVLDASGSMWGQINGTPKISIARQVIRDFLNNWDPDMELGLVAYGHNKKGDCKDIQVLVPVGFNTREKILQVIETLNPKGKTPLSDAVMVAANALKYTEDRATVILVSDGEETCSADPCALGTELEKTGLDFTAHVIGFDIKKDQEKGLRCLAKNTGGTYHPASDAGSLKQALEKTVTEVKKKTKGIILKAVTGTDGQLYQGQINWYVLEQKADLSGKRKEIKKMWRGKASQPFPSLLPGQYRVVAQLSDAKHIKASKDIKIVDEPTQAHEVMVGFGKVRFNAKIDLSDQVFKMDLAYRVLAAKADFSGKRKEIINFWRVKNGSVFLLPVGDYKIAGTLPDAKYIYFEKDISVTHGSQEAHEFVIHAGWVRFDARPSANSDPYKTQVAWKIFSNKADFSGKHKKLVDFWRVSSGKIFILPKGEWLVKGILPDYPHIIVKQTISLASAQELPVEIIFNTAWVKFNITLDGAPYNGQIGWNVFSDQKDLSGKQTRIADGWRVKSQTVTTLKQGDYIVEVMNPDLKTMKGKAAFTLKPGDQAVVDIDMKTP